MSPKWKTAGHLGVTVEIQFPQFMRLTQQARVRAAAGHLRGIPVTDDELRNFANDLRELVGAVELERSKAAVERMRTE